MVTVSLGLVDDGCGADAGWSHRPLCVPELERSGGGRSLQPRSPADEQVVTAVWTWGGCWSGAGLGQPDHPAQYHVRPGYKLLLHHDAATREKNDRSVRERGRGGGDQSLT